MKKSPFIIAVSGDPVAGKSSAIQALMERYAEEGMAIGAREEGNCIIKLSAGQMYRDLAEQSQINQDGKTPFEFLNGYAKQPGNTMRKLREISPNPDFLSGVSDEILDKSVDAFIDDYMLLHTDMLNVKYAGKDDVIIILDSRIAGLLMKAQGKEVMGIRFAIQPEIAAERLVKRAQTVKGEIDIEGLSNDEAFNLALNSQRQRTANERERFIKAYSKDINDQEENAKVDLQNLENYNLVINTSGTTIDREVVVLYSCIEKAREGKSYDKFWRSTKYIYPGSVTKEEIDPSKEPRIKAIKVGTQYYALHGQEYVGIANHAGYVREQMDGSECDYPLVPVELVAKKRELFFETDKDGNLKGVSADLYVESYVTDDFVRNFENDYGFKYPERGVAKLKTLDQIRAENKYGNYISKFRTIEQVMADDRRRRSGPAME